ncbi:unnamed protein product [Miscanthus lutarioriparius]|uniref:non-specific serine/threonine protein kinase n=1 Tax=Miscanthus lutarioriparius TaxID=422564 RepID=A0A811RDT3_9POAL|nr:unnamed protein product [Miscanthus lutarioriparius]
MDHVPARVLAVCLMALLPGWASALGSMSSIAVSYGEDGPVFCGLNSDGSHLVAGDPPNIPFLGLTAGDGFVCGLLLDTRQLYCWGSNSYVKSGVPQPMVEGARGTLSSARGTATSARCELRLKMGAVDGVLLGRRGGEWCRSVVGPAPRDVRFQSIGAGGYLVCGVLENAQVFCWGRSLEMQQVAPSSAIGDGDVNIVPMDAMVASMLVASGALTTSTSPPKGMKMYALVAGDYFTCGVPAETSLMPGNSGPLALPMAVPPGICVPTACSQGYYYVNHGEVGSIKVCKPANSRLCLPCSTGCPEDSYESSPCNAKADRVCQFDCSRCATDECLSFCLSQKQTKSRKLMAFQMRIFVAEIVFAVILVLSVSVISCLYVRHKLRHCQCSNRELRLAKSTAYSFRKDNMRIQPDVEDLKIRRAQEFSYEEFEQATGGFSEDSQVGKGSFSCVFKGILRDGTVVAVKRAIKASDVKKSSKEFHNELDLLSRLNHAHLLNLLGYCEDGSERLLVYEFMAHGSLYQHLHGKDPNLKKRLNWARRVTIAVQAARGIEYLHGYACPPVIHRDIKSSNILIDEDHNARVADFGLSILGPADSSTPLSELPAGTLGYLDPEYYRLHYLTTKSDVYSFGVVLLEILSGRKAIDMQFEEGNIVEWAVPLIKAGDIFRLSLFLALVVIRAHCVLVCGMARTSRRSWRARGRSSGDLYTPVVGWRGNGGAWRASFSAPAKDAGETTTTIFAILDPALSPPSDLEALKKIASVACKCVRMRGKDRPSMDKVTTALEHALALLMGSPCIEQPILLTEVVLGSSRMHKVSQMSSNHSCSENGLADGEDQRIEYRAPSWITFPSVTSSQRRKSSASEADIVGRRTTDGRNVGSSIGDGLR